MLFSVYNDAYSYVVYLLLILIDGLKQLFLAIFYESEKIKLILNLVNPGKLIR